MTRTPFALAALSLAILSGCNKAPEETQENTVQVESAQAVTPVAPFVPSSVSSSK